jgi:predicted aspartyl protease
MFRRGQCVARTCSIATVFLIFCVARAWAGGTWSSYRAQDFFRLRQELPSPAAGEPEDVRFLRAAVLAAFGRTEDSAQLLSRLLAGPLENRALEARARELLMLDLRAQFRYAAALGAVSPLLASASSRDAVEDLRNRAELLRAVSEVPVQTVRPGSSEPLAMDEHGQLRIRLGRGMARMAFDTGANFSVVSRSAALRLGMRVRRADYTVASPLGGRVRADVAAGDVTFEDGTSVANALFLVLPDGALAMADGRSADGLIGLPVIAALGRIEFRPGRVVIGSAGAPSDASAELALSANDPLLRVSFRGHELLCRLDTGAERSVFYEPFYRLLGDVPTRRRSLRIGGAAGTHVFDAREMVAPDISIAGRRLALARAVVLTAPLTGTANAGLACGIGRDAFAGLSYYAIDLRRMRLTLGSPRRHPQQ